MVTLAVESRMTEVGVILGHEPVTDEGPR